MGSSGPSSLTMCHPHLSERCAHGAGAGAEMGAQGRWRQNEGSSVLRHLPHPGVSAPQSLSPSLVLGGCCRGRTTGLALYLGSLARSSWCPGSRLGGFQPAAESAEGWGPPTAWPGAPILARPSLPPWRVQGTRWHGCSACGRAHAFLLLCRSSKWNVQDEQSLRLEGEVLAEALQRYLPYLEALSQAAAPRTLPGPKLDRPLLQVTLRAFSGLGWARTWGFSGYLPYPGPGEGARTHGLDPNLAVWLRGPLRGTAAGRRWTQCEPCPVAETTLAWALQVEVLGHPSRVLGGVLALGEFALHRGQSGFKAYGKEQFTEAGRNLMTFRVESVHDAMTAG